MSKHRHWYTTAFALAVALALPLQAAPALSAETPVIKPLNMAEASLRLAYETVWSNLDRMYANRDKVPADWADWQHKFDGQLHGEQDLTKALDSLIAHIGDPQIRLLNPGEVAASEAKKIGWHFGYGVSSKWLPVHGRTATIRVHNPDGPGGQAGLQNGDKLVAVNHESFAGMEDWDLFAFIGSHRDQVTLTVLRGGQLLDIVAHPGDTNVNFGLDIAIDLDGNYGAPYVFAISPGPAMQVGLGEKEELELVNGKPADQMGDAELKTLSKECSAGDILRLKVKRLPNEVDIPCGLVNDGYMSGTAGGMGGEAIVWQVSLKNLDQPGLIHWMESFLAEYAQKQDVRKVIDLRAASGSDERAVAKLASYFVHDGSIDCMSAGWRTDSICSVVEGGVVFETNSDSDQKRVMSTAAPQFNGAMVVVIDDATTGTALLLAGALQDGGAKIVTAGSAVRPLSNAMTSQSLHGDPAARWIEYPIWHYTLSQKRADVTADFVVDKGQEFAKAGEYLNLKSAPYDQRAYD